MAKSDRPWAIKGVSPAARHAAKEAARQAGMPLGEWLTQIIHTISADERAAASRKDGESAGPLRQREGRDDDNRRD